MYGVFFKVHRCMFHSDVHCPFTLYSERETLSMGHPAYLLLLPIQIKILLRQPFKILQLMQKSLLTPLSLFQQLYSSKQRALKITIAGT